ncbi:hypothetical protein EVAR_24984_1 [Eumeta japonica]|uniref:Uncharacterized protein n=1 Tax=Eumeta variegata TaxID=151549 RepID=A0A4C1XKS2_EUMVA|nr:hypothetical protein EVAR_24984_1 [Eumeta japonica]
MGTTLGTQVLSARPTCSPPQMTLDPKLWRRRPGALFAYLPMQKYAIIDHRANGRAPTPPAFRTANLVIHVFRIELSGDGHEYLYK